MANESVVLQGGPDRGSQTERGAPQAVDTSKFFGTMTEIIRAPRQFFAQLEDTQENYRNSLKYLAYASLFYTMVSMTYFYSHKLAMAGILMINCLVLPALLAALTMLVLALFFGRRVPLRRVVSIYAFASGTVMPLSWIPAMQVITEPIRALLVIVGLTKACDMRWWQAALAILVTLGLFLMLFWSALPVIMQIKQALVG
ncbi:MAG: YIP1 family protein [Desulfovibrionaceae bacterium]